MKTALIRCAFLIILAGAVASSVSAKTIRVGHPDNLIRTHDLDCISLEQVMNDHTPADLSAAVVRCARRGKFDQATQLFFVYSVYGYFDQNRVRDRSARSAVGALNQLISQSLTRRQKRKFQAATERTQDRSGPLFKETCAIMRRLGPPDYVPLYMLAHGLDAFRFVGGKTHYLSRRELRKSLLQVNAGKLWEESLHTNNKCPR